MIRRSMRRAVSRIASRIASRHVSRSVPSPTTRNDARMNASDQCTPVARGGARAARPIVRQRSGVALVVVLWTVALLASVTAMASSAARSSAQLATNRRALAIARAMSESAIVAATAIVNDSLAIFVADSSRRDVMLASLEPSTTAAPFLQDTLGDGVFAVTFVDVSARLDVNNAGAEGLAMVLRSVTDDLTATRLARAIDARVRGDDVATLPTRETSALNARATTREASEPAMREAVERAQRRADAEGKAARDSLGARLLGREAPQQLRHPFESLDALLEIDGMTEALLADVAPFLTVDGDGRINQRSASSLVRQAAAGSLVDRPARLLCIARGWQRGHSLTREIQAVYDVSDDGLRLVRWRESSR